MPDNSLPLGRLTEADDAIHPAEIAGYRSAQAQPVDPGPAVDRNGPGKAQFASASSGLRPIGLFQDIPSLVWKLFLSAWASFFALIGLFFAVDADSAFLVTIVILFGAMAFGLPMTLARQCHDPDHRCSGDIGTFTGPITFRAAAIQIALIPIAVVIGLLGFILFAR